MLLEQIQFADFKKHLLDNMGDNLKNDRYFFRGVSSDSQRTNTFFDPKSRKRESQYSGSKVDPKDVFPGWENIHPRLHSIIGTTSMEYAAEWGDNFVLVVPQDGATISYIEVDDFNYGGNMLYHKGDTIDIYFSGYSPYAAINDLKEAAMVPTSSYEQHGFKPIAQTITMLYTKLFKPLFDQHPDMMKFEMEFTFWDRLQRLMHERKFKLKQNTAIQKYLNQAFVHSPDPTVFLYMYKHNVDFQTVLQQLFSPEAMDVHTIPMTQFNTIEKENFEVWTSDPVAIISQDWFKHLSR